MGDTTAKTEQAAKKSWFAGLKGEFGKIIWPDRKTVVNRTTAVVLITILLGVVIKVADLIIQAGFSILFK